MIKFKATTLEDEGSFEGSMEDLGLCFVSKYTIDGVEFYSVLAKELGELPNGGELRMAEDQASARSFGYKILHDTIEPTE